jgi:hypothetical protein
MARDSDENTPATDTMRAADQLQPPPADRKYLLERVDEAAVAQLYADGFAAVPLDQKLLIWHLYEAALAGRDIFYDQRYAHNLAMRDSRRGAARWRPVIDVVTEIWRYTVVLDQFRAVQSDARKLC